MMYLRIQEDPSVRRQRLLGQVVDAAVDGRDPWVALHGVLADMRQDCLDHGGDARQYAGFVACWLAEFTTIPVRVGAGE